MTRILFLPNDQTFLLLESSVRAEEVVAAVQAGQWVPPEPYRAALEELALGEFTLCECTLAEPVQQPVLNAFQQGSLVIITTLQPLELEARLAAAPRAAHARQTDVLTPRQHDVLQALADGLTTKEIALRMGLHQRTVAMHVAALKQRLGASTRAQSVGRAAALGLCRAGKQSAAPRREPIT